MFLPDFKELLSSWTRRYSWVDTERPKRQRLLSRRKNSGYVNTIRALCEPCLNSYYVITILMSRVLTGKVRRVGNSLAVIIPKELSEESGASEGDTITGDYERESASKRCGAEGRKQGKSGRETGPDLDFFWRGIVPAQAGSKRAGGAEDLRELFEAPE